MFCLDFAFAFFIHGIIVKYTHNEHRFLTNLKQSPPPSSFPSTSVGPRIAWTYGLGGLSGLGAAIALYPFDIVRMSVIEKGKSHFAFSSIPYMSVYLGTYFIIRDEKWTFLEKFGFANVAAGLGAVAELPFDQAKVAISGSTRMAVITTGMRIPLAALLLVSYDQILVGKIVRKKAESDGMHT